MVSKIADTMELLVRIDITKPKPSASPVIRVAISVVSLPLLYRFEKGGTVAPQLAV